MAKSRRGRDEEDALAAFESLEAELAASEALEEAASLKRQVRNLQHSVSIIETLLAVSASINSTLNLDELLRKVVDAVVEITGCDRGFLMLRDEDGSFGFAIARNRDRRDLPESDFEVSHSVVHQVAESGQPLFLSNVQELDAFKDQKSILDLDIHTAICIPLAFEEKVMGVIYADSRRITSPFGESDLALIKAFGAQAAVAIENARRHGELELAKRQLEERARALERELTGQEEFAGMVGRSKAMREIFDVIRKVAPRDTTVLIQGETGTGKELVARAIHRNSARRDKPMLSINCGALPKELLESELFGHRKGAFTGADRDKMGIFEAAEGGTIFLDEIGEMPVELQVKLLRVLQEGEVRRVGEERPRRVDVRILSATNRDLAEEVRNGRFRQDLFYRLNVVPITIPPLRERVEDILPLAEHFLEKYALAMDVPKPRLSKEAKEVLLNYAWPGNVRELEHTIERALALGEGARVLEDRHFEYLRGEPKVPEEGLTLKALLERWEREVIERTLVKCDGNVTRTAEALGISRQQLYTKMRKLGIRADR
jgi:Nif-specific regulatory protein